MAAVATLLLLPTGASAHALLVSSTPKPGDILGTPPGVVVLEFSQVLNARLSAASVHDPSGHSWAGSVTTGEEIRVPLATSLTGVYEVKWSSVSVTDGHQEAGSFRFGVGIGAGALTAAGASAGNPGATEVLISVARWVEALALLLLVGELTIGALAKRAPPLPWVQPRYFSASLALSAGLVVVWAEATIASGGHALAGYVSYFGSGLAEAMRPLRVVFELLALLSVVRRWRGLPAWVGGAVAALAVAGHAGDLEPGAYGIALNAVHLVAAGVWAGGVAALALTRPPGGWRSVGGRALLSRFTPPALVGFAVTVVGGGLQAVGQLGSLEALTGTAYGRVLLAKIGLVGLMLPLSLLAWRWRRLHLRSESAIAALVVAAAALLAAFPLPPTALARQAAAAATAGSPVGLPGVGQLTLGGNAGSVLVGVTLDPGLPGANRVIVYLLPVQGSQEASGLVANVSADGVTRALTGCGDTCRQANLSLDGGEELDVDVLGPVGGRATLTVPPLPAATGTGRLATMQAAMHAVSSYAVSETLTSGIGVVHSDYASQAPDRSVWTVEQRSETVVIGSTQYTRDDRGQPWRVETGLPALRIPSFVWDYFQPLTYAYVVGAATIDGVQTTAVSAFGSRSGTAIWFTFWLDSSGLARRVDMRAPGHFMTDSYVRFNADEGITAPALSPG